jgi:hypothetical protein
MGVLRHMRTRSLRAWDWLWPGARRALRHHDWLNDDQAGVNSGKVSVLFQGPVLTTQRGTKVVH